MDILGSQAWSYIAIPLIWAFMVLIRTGCLALFNLTAFSWVKERAWRCRRPRRCGREQRRERSRSPRLPSQALPARLSTPSSRRRPRPPAGLTWAEVAFTGWAGLRGAISLIMTADFIAHRCGRPGWGGWQGRGQAGAARGCAAAVGRLHAWRAWALRIDRRRTGADPLRPPPPRGSSRPLRARPAAPSCRATPTTPPTPTAKSVSLADFF